MNLRRCFRRTKRLYFVLFCAAVVFPFFLRHPGVTVQYRRVSLINSTMPRLSRYFDANSVRNGNDSMGEFKEVEYKEPVDLVYLWANGSDPRFILDVKRQKALEDAEQYQSPLYCRLGWIIQERFHVVVVYPALSRTTKLSANENVHIILNLSEKYMNYSVIIPKQNKEADGFMRTLTEIEGHTFISFCGYITNEQTPQAKRTLGNIYHVKSKNHQSVNVITENMEGVGTILQDDAREGRDVYTLVYGKPDVNSDIVTKAIEKLKRSGLEVKPAVLVWDTEDLEIEGVPNANRFEDNEQLKYSIRSVEKFAPWIKHIYIITNDQIPSWLNVSNTKVSVVYTEEIFPNKNDLPTFSSPAIESYMYRIPGLAETFLFMCDDFFFGQYVRLSDFYTAEEGLKIDWEGPIANCMTNCANRDIGNGKCDKACDTLKCGWDHGDCRTLTREDIKHGHPVGHHYGSTFHTMGLFNRRKSGFNQSLIYQMPPHAPLMVNKRVAIELAKTFKEEFEKSSAFHFRTQFNVQYTMAYLHFVWSSLEVMTVEQIFDKVDEDMSGTLSLKELGNLARMVSKTTSKKEIGNLMNATLNCLSIVKHGFTRNKSEGEYRTKQISKSVFTHCPGIVDILTRAKLTKPRYKHKLVSAKNAHFTVLDKRRSSKKALLAMLKEPRKFNTINDNMDHSEYESEEIKVMLKKFHQTMFPTPSQFELRGGN